MSRSRPTMPVSRRAAFVGAGGLGLTVAARGLLASAQEATPAAAAFSTFDHPLIGTWQWTHFPDSYPSLSFATFTQGGGYVEVSDTLLQWLNIGVWRATGERTAEVVMNPGVAISLDAAFDSGYVIPETCLVTRDMQLLRVMIEVDATGNRLAGTGRYEVPVDEDSVVPGMAYEGIGERMMIASDVTATPAS